LPSARSLFEFGDTDGIGNEARLQHPLGIVYHEGALFVADSYNHKIKRINLKTRESTTFLGNGKPGVSLNPPHFAEPAGLSIANGKLYVADTNNHRIVVVDLKSKIGAALTITGLTPPKPEQTESAVDVRGEEEDVPPQKVALTLPENFKLNPAAPVTYTLTADGDQKLIAADQLNVREEATAEGTTLKFRVPLAAKSGQATLHLAINYQYCRDGTGGVCKLGSAQYAIPVQVTSEGKGSTIRLTATAK
jgi:hypothetical protein